jgi:circadian clock protein KaiC
MNEMLQTNWVKKIPTYITGFDQVSYGGLPAGRTTLLAGSAGSAKTVFAAQFIAAGIREADQAGVFVAFEEPPSDITLNIQSLGWPIRKWVEEKKWAFVDASPEPDDETFKSGSHDLGALLARIEHAVRRFNATRIAVDSLGAIFSRFDDAAVVRRELLRISSALKNMGITSLIKHKKVVGLFTATRPSLVGGASVTDAHISTSTDTIILLRYAEMFGEMRRGVTVLKMRGSMHEKAIREFMVDDRGMHIGDPIRNVTGILTGQPMYAPNQEMERIGSMFAGDPSDPDS